MLFSIIFTESTDDWLSLTDAVQFAFQIKK